MTRFDDPRGSERLSRHTRSHVAARLIVSLACCLLMSGCKQEGGPRAQMGCPSTSPWTTYFPDDDDVQAEFLNLVTHCLRFPPPDNSPSQPKDATGPVTVAIRPEASVSSMATVDSLHFKLDEPASKSVGRVMAKIVLADARKDFPELGLRQDDLGFAFVIWWVEVNGDPEWDTWTNHYFLVNTEDNTVTEIDDDEQKFAFVDEHYPRPVHEADWNRHNDVLNRPPRVRTESVRQFKHGNSTWVSCGSGCCNGR